jgi:DNA-binding NarL/FixJ family response regulator
MPDRLYMPFVENYGAEPGNTLNVKNGISPILEGFGDSFNRADIGMIKKLAGEFEAGRNSVLSRMFPNRPYGLTAREFSVARLAAQRFGNGEIAEETGLCESTVKQYLHSAFGKMGVKKRAALAALLDETGTCRRERR